MMIIIITIIVVTINIIIIIVIVIIIIIILRQTKLRLETSESIERSGFSFHRGLSLFFRHNIDTSCGVHPASYITGGSTEIFFSGSKRAGARN
jgi:hypothetical protein